MTYLWTFLLFVPIAYLVMVVYVAPHATAGGQLLRMAVPKTGKVLFWTAVIVAAMQLIQFVFLP